MRPTSNSAATSRACQVRVVGHLLERVEEPEVALAVPEEPALVLAGNVGRGALRSHLVRSVRLLVPALFRRKKVARREERGQQLGGRLVVTWGATKRGHGPRRERTFSPHQNLTITGPIRVLPRMTAAPDAPLKTCARRGQGSLLGDGTHNKRAAWRSKRVRLEGAGRCVGSATRAG